MLNQARFSVTCHLPITECCQKYVLTISPIWKGKEKIGYIILRRPVTLEAQNMPCSNVSYAVVLATILRGMVENTGLYKRKRTRNRFSPLAAFMVGPINKLRCEGKCLNDLCFW